MERVRARGVMLAEGHGERTYEMEPALQREVRHLYEDSRVCLRAELPAAFASSVAGAVALRTTSADRNDYILHPPTGEVLTPDTAARATCNRSFSHSMMSCAPRSLALQTRQSS